MAGLPPPTFAELLAATSAYVMPTQDVDVKNALTAYHLNFKKTNGPAHAEARLDLLAGIAWLHTHHENLGPALAKLTIAQSQVLATALDLDFAISGSLDIWPTMVERRLLARQPPGTTPKKNKAAASSSAGVDGQIQKPGGGNDPQAYADAAKPKKAKTAAVDTSSGSSSTSSGSDVEVMAVPDRGERPTTAVDLMPSELGFGPAFDSLVTAGCARRWLPSGTLQRDIPAEYIARLCKGRLWPPKELKEYEKMIDAQSSSKGKAARRENPQRVAHTHRVSLIFTTDEDLVLNSNLLRLIVEGERLSDWAGDNGRLLGGQAARGVFKTLISDLRTSWQEVRAAAFRREHVGAPAISGLIDLLLAVLERRYARLATVLPAGRVREEVLCNVARQTREARTFFASFTKNLADRAGGMPYALQATFAAERYVNLLESPMNFLLETECGHVPGGFRLGDADPEDPAPADPPAGRASRAGILRPTSLSVSFASPPPAQPAPAPQAAHPATVWPTFPMNLAQFASPPTYFPQPWQPPPAAMWPGGPGGAHGPPPQSHAAGRLAGPAPPPPLPHIKPEPGASAGPSREKDRRNAPDKSKKFASQPMHAYVTGVDVATVPLGEVWDPQCGCANHHNLNPGLHAVWDCPHRYLSKFGECPGFLPSGRRDPSKWTPDGANLTRAGKDEWVSFLERNPLPLPLSYFGAPPDFRS